MNNSALIGVHRLKGYISACTNGSCSVLFGKRNKSTLALFTVIADVYGNALIARNTAVCNHSCKVLYSVESLAASAYYYAVIIAAVKLKNNFLVVCKGFNAAFGKSETLDDFRYIRSGFFVLVCLLQRSLFLLFGLFFFFDLTGVFLFGFLFSVFDLFGSRSGFFVRILFGNGFFLFLGNVNPNLYLGRLSAENTECLFLRHL